MSGVLEKSVSVILAACAVAFVGLLAWREFGTSNVSQFGDDSKPPELVQDWEGLKSRALPIGTANSNLVVVEFADLECPACKQFHGRLREAATAAAINVDLRFIHFPLTIHRFANQAGIALECAARGGEGADFVDIAYAKQDSFGLKPWVSYAKEAGISDTTSFEACMRDPASLARVNAGRLLGDSLDIRGTPVVVMNGWRFHRVPAASELPELLVTLASNQAPPGAGKR
jgi:protein-disulfide isomerase